MENKEITSPTPPTNPLIHLGVGLVAFTVLFVQVELTRIFSVMIWYHFSFFVVSTVLLGFSAAGGWLELSDRWRKIPPSRFLGISALLFSIGMVASFWCITNLPFTSYNPVKGSNSIKKDLMWAGSLAAVIMPPFFAAGACLCGALAIYKEKASNLYCSIMVGSGLGALFAVIAIGPLTGPQAVMLGPIFAALAALLLEKGGSRSHPLTEKSSGSRTFARTGVLLLLPIALLGLIIQADRVFPVRSSKVTRSVSEDNFRMRDWNYLSCIDFYDDPRVSGLWGLSPTYLPRPYPTQMIIYIDSWAFTNITKWDGQSQEQLEFLDYLPSYTAYMMLKDPEVLVIGAGGGIDLLAGVRYGAHNVTAVEINPGIYEGMRETYKDYSGGIYTHPKIKTILGEGRNHLDTTDQKYDMIQLDGVDTLTATQAGAFSLTENYLYTEEAFDRYLIHLKPGGILTMTRWLDRGQTVRLLATAEQALERARIQNPEKHIMLLGSGYFSVLLVRNQPFSEEEIQRVIAKAGEMQYDLLYYPGLEKPNDYQAYMVAADKNQYLRDYKYRVHPVTDDSPFFFEQEKESLFSKPGAVLMGDIGARGILFIIFAEFVIFALLLLVLPLLFRRGAERFPLDGGFLLFFFAIGLGYIIIEISLIQKLVLLLGHPIYALTVVLATMLCASGLGSLAGPMTGIPARKRALLAALAIALIGALYAAFLGRMVHSLIGTPVPLRFLAAFVVVAPLGFIMGMPFPGGLELIQRRGSGAVAWGWAANGCASVGGSALAMIVTLESSYSMSLFVGAAAYALALVGLLLARREPSTALTDPAMS